jgi:protein-disulfide isomerase
MSAASQGAASAGWSPAAADAGAAGVTAGQARTPQLAAPIGDRDHVQGPPRAPVTLVMYGDFECPYTLHARTIIRAALRRTGDRVRYVFRHFPLEKHPHAFRAAEAAEAAAAQGKFWPMYDLLFDNQWALEDDNLAAYADQLGLDAARFARDLSEHAHASSIREDVESGRRSGVTGTPALFVDGVRYPDLEDDLDQMVAVLERAA